MVTWRERGGAAARGRLGGVLSKAVACSLPRVTNGSRLYISSMYPEVHAMVINRTAGRGVRVAGTGAPSNEQKFDADSVLDAVADIWVLGAMCNSLVVGYVSTFGRTAALLSMSSDVSFHDWCGRLPATLDPCFYGHRGFTAAFQTNRTMNASEGARTWWAFARACEPPPV